MGYSDKSQGNRKTTYKERRDTCKVKSDQSSWFIQEVHRATEFFLIEFFTRTSYSGNGFLLIDESNLHLDLRVVRIK